MKKRYVVLIVLAAAAALGIYFYTDYRKQQELRYPKFYSGNGRLEATEVYISTRLPERVEKIFVKTGQIVHKGDKLVQMRDRTLKANEAGTVAAIMEKEGELAMAKAHVKLTQSAFDGANKEYIRQKSLVATGAVSQKAFDEAETNYKNTLAQLEYAKASVIAAEGKLASQKAELQRIREDIRDCLLTARHDGRIQYKLAQEGEVLAAGGRAMNLVNLTDTYMTFFLPTQIAGQVRMGAEVKLIFDAAPDYPIDAKVTFIDPVAQFTPKSVETRVEREKMMFRIKASLDAKELLKYLDDVKTGLPGVAWVKVDPEASWKDAPLKVLREKAQ